MDKKLVLLTAFLLLFSGFASAQFDQTWQGAGEQAVGLFTQTMNFLAGDQLDLSEVDDSISFAAGLAIIWFVIYIALELGLKRAGLLEKITGSGRHIRGDEGSNRRLIILSFLLLAVMFGSGAIIPLVAAMIEYTVLTVVLFFASVGAMIWIAGSGIAIGGIQGARGVHKSSRAAGEAKQAGQAAYEAIKQAESEDKEGMTEQAIEDTEEAIQLVLESEKDLEEVLRTDIEELEDAVERLEDYYNADRDEEERIEDVERALERLAQIFASDKSRGDKANAAANVLSEVMTTVRALEADENREGEDLKAALEELEDVLSNLAGTFQTAQNIRKLIQEEEGELEHLIQRANEEGAMSGYAQEFQTEEKQLEEVEKLIQDIENKESQAIQLLEKAEQILQNTIKLDEEEIQMLKTELGEGSEVEEYIYEMVREAGDIDANVDDLVEQLTAFQELSNVGGREEQFLEHEEKLLNDIESVLNSIRG